MTRIRRSDLLRLFRVHFVLLSVLPLMIVGCASQRSNMKETPFDRAKVDKIQENVTSAKEVLSMLGPPGIDNRDSKGNGGMVYYCKSYDSNGVQARWLRLYVVDGIVKKCTYTEHVETDGGSVSNNSSGKLIPIKMIPF